MIVLFFKLCSVLFATAYWRWKINIFSMFWCSCFECFKTHIGNTWDLHWPVDMGTSILFQIRTQRGVFCMLLLLLLCCFGGKCEPQESKPSTLTNFPTVKPLHNQINEPQAFPEEERASLPVFTMDYPRIQVPFEFTLWVLLASFAKIGMVGRTTMFSFMFVHEVIGFF